MAARAVRRECWLAFTIQNRFGHDRARGISRAKKENVVARLHACTLGASTVLQHVGPQQSRFAAASLAAGFFARTNALATLPSTCGAIASTSMPCVVRNCLASSTL